MKKADAGLYDIAGSAHPRNEAGAGIVVYRDYEARKIIVSTSENQAPADVRRARTNRVLVHGSGAGV